MKEAQIYLANNLGFCGIHSQALSMLEVNLIAVARHHGVRLAVIEPFRDNPHNPLKCAGELKPLDIARWDRDKVTECDAIFAVLEGTPPDEGVFWELGYAAALGKLCFFFRSDFRRYTDNDLCNVNLMVLAGLPESTKPEDVDGYWYADIDDLYGEDGAFVKWLLNLAGEKGR